MPILFWLPSIFVSALFELVALPSIPEQSKDIRMLRNHHQLPNEDPATLLDKTDECRPEDVADLKAQIADLKQVIISLHAQLADMHEQMNRWQSRSDRVSLTAPY